MTGSRLLPNGPTAERAAAIPCKTRDKLRSSADQTTGKDTSGEETHDDRWSVALRMEEKGGRYDGWRRRVAPRTNDRGRRRGRSALAPLPGALPLSLVLIGERQLGCTGAAIGNFSRPHRVSTCLLNPPHKGPVGKITTIIDCRGPVPATPSYPYTTLQRLHFLLSSQ